MTPKKRSKQSDEEATPSRGRQSVSAAGEHLSEDNGKRKMFAVYLTDEEKVLLARAAKKNGERTLGPYIVECALSAAAKGK